MATKVLGFKRSVITPVKIDWERKTDQQRIKEMEDFVDSLELENGSENITEFLRKKSFKDRGEEGLLRYALENPPEYWEHKFLYIVAFIDEWRLRQK
jgi:hypothetical protein